MALISRWNIAVVTIGFLILAGCAQSPMHRDANRAEVNCPAGQTLTCEANNIGRIRHGTFARSTDKCACVHDDGRSLNSPVIPSIQ